MIGNILSQIWALKWWEIFVIACVDDIFFLVKAWFIWVTIIGLILLTFIITKAISK